MTNRLSIVIAGATGLIGKSAVEIALDNESVEHIYSLSRRPITIEHSKLTQWLSPDLSIPSEGDVPSSPIIGVITLGTTLKKAGSKEKLKAIDVDLVVNVAKDMHKFGAKHIIVVSCLGASVNSRSHYLRCKGEMEAELQQLEFEKVTFMHPGTLVGSREETRKDEKVLQCVLNMVSPLMIGVLADFKPVKAHDVADAIIQLATQQNNSINKGIEHIRTPQILNLCS
jgi:uncharacterized protein YbjT (DUF2867 family)